jgi:cell shape-determining protein MreC
MSRLARWFLRHDPTTACDWTPEEADETAEKLVAAVFDLAALRAENELLRARLAELEAEADELNQENMVLHDMQNEADAMQARISAGEPVPFRSPRPSLSLVTQNADDAIWAALYGEQR